MAYNDTGRLISSLVAFATSGKSRGLIERYRAPQKRLIRTIKGEEVDLSDYFDFLRLSFD